jgi:hypothetical protein
MNDSFNYYIIHKKQTHKRTRNSKYSHNIVKEPTSILLRTKKSTFFILRLSAFA